MTRSVPGFVGADCAGGLYARLLPLPTLCVMLDPLMEDWGWYAGVRVIDSANWCVAIMIYPWDYLDDCWLIGLRPSGGLFDANRMRSYAAS